MNFTGTLRRLSTKTGVGRRGPWTLYSGKVEKPDGTEYEKWISFGFEKPAVEEGKFYSIEAEEDAKGFIKSTKITAVDPPKAAHTKEAKQGTVEWINPESVQDSIRYQSSRKDAIEFVKLAVGLDALPMLKTAGKAGEAKRFVELQALVDKLTIQFFFDVGTLRLLESVEDAGNVESEESQDPTPSSSDED